MAEFLADVIKLDKQAVKMSIYSQRILNFRSQMMLVRQNLIESGGNSTIGSMLETSLDYLEVDLEAETKDMQKLCETLDDIRGLYEQTETSIVENQLLTEKSLWDKLLDGDLSGSVLSGEKTWTNIIGGVHTAATVSGGLLNGELSFGVHADGDQDKNVGVSAEIEAKGTLAEGKVTGKYGYLYGDMSGAVGAGSVKGEAKATLFQEGKFDPQLSATASASVAVAQGEVEAGFGTEDNNVHVKASGELGTAEAEAGLQLGKVENAKTGQLETGVSVSASAKATGAKGTVSGGTTICGIDIDVSVSGEAGSVGVEAGASITESGFKVNAGVAALLGVDGSISVDWSDFKLPWE